MAHETAGVDGEEERCHLEDEEWSEGIEGEDILFKVQEAGGERADKPLADEEDVR